VRDAAYESLLKSRRKQLHAGIARALEERFPVIAEAEPGVLARHCSEAGLVDKAVEYWLKAGQQAVARSAMAEAMAQFRRGLDLLGTVPDTPERRNLELELQVALGSVLMFTKGFAAAETTSAYARARELCLQVGATPKIFPVLFGQWLVRQGRGELAAAHELAVELLRLAEERGDVAAQVTGCRAVGSTLAQLGRFVESRAYLERGLALYNPQRVVSLHWLSHALLALGYPEQALARMDEAFAYARELTHPDTMAVALRAGCTLYERLRQSRDAQAMAEALIALATEQGFPLWPAMGTVTRGWALADAGRTEEGIGEIRRGLDDYRATGAELWSPYFLVLLAEAHGWAGQAAAGISVLAEAFDRVERGGARWIEPDLHRLKGELLLALPEPDPVEAEARFRRAITVAREQSAKMMDLRSATNLARLWRDQGRRDEARELLAPVYGWFTEGFDTLDLRDAKALLDALR
jgi:predicted ATPase